MLLFISSHLSLILSCLLIISEAMGAIAQLAFPDNKGLAGILASIVKALQSLGAKSSGQK